MVWPSTSNCRTHSSLPAAAASWSGVVQKTSTGSGWSSCAASTFVASSCVSCWSASEMGACTRVVSMSNLVVLLYWNALAEWPMTKLFKDCID